MKQINTVEDLNELIASCEKQIAENKRAQEEMEKSMRDFEDRMRRFSEEVAEITTRPIRLFIEELKRL